MAKVLTTIPTALDTDVVRNVFLAAQFDTDLDSSSISDLTVILVKSSDRSVVDGVADYVHGTRTVTFQLGEVLDPDTEYTWIIVGRDEGVKTLAGVAALSANEQVTFTTGGEDDIDPNIPLATETRITGDIPAFQGGDGIYTVVFGATGEPISHVVTTAGQVGPSGLIIPAPAGSAAYLAASGTLEPDAIQLSGLTDPEDGETFLDISNLTEISVYFDDIPVLPTVSNSGVTVEVSNMLGLDVTQPTISTAVTGNKLAITPDVWGGAATYEVTLSKNIEGETLLALGTDYTFSFSTKPVTFYTTVKLVQVNLGVVASTFTDLQIQELIYENSLWAFQNHATGFDVGSPPIYVKEYVLCKTKLDVLNRSLMGTNAITSERIGEVEFRYGTDVLERFKSKMEDLEDCVDDNGRMILSGGARTSMRTATKSLRHPGRPGTAGTWRRIESDGSFKNKNAPKNNL